jgi:deoxyribonuclease (pyrimidine dimer)
MVRINLINPKNLSDQHLIAEYNEILMLIGYVKKHPQLEKIPKNYALGKGHIIFFKNKLKYLKNRHEQIKKEMKKRGFKAEKTINIGKFSKEMQKDWRPSAKDKEIIKKRLIERVKLKPDFHKYYRKKRTKKFLVDLVKEGTK